MTVQNPQRLARIGSPGTGISIAAVFGVEWLVDLAYSAYNAAIEVWKTCLRRRLSSAESESCSICDDECWPGDLLSCSNDENRHWYCLKCLDRTITAMLTGDVAFSYDPRTTLPLCCYCVQSSSSSEHSDTQSSILDIQPLSPQMRRSWDKAIMTRQLQALDLPLITCAQCGYVVVDEREDSEQRPAPQPTLSSEGLASSVRRRLKSITSYISSSSCSTKKPMRFHCPECDFLTCLPPQGCGSHFPAGHADDHKCRTDDLRLEIERAVDKSLIYKCPSCSTPLVKDGGCNHCTCLCHAEYCHICHASLGRGESSVWRTHFCDHFIEGGGGRCTQLGCRRCPLYSDRDDEGIRRRVEGEVTRRWRRQQVWNGIKSFVGWG